MAEETVEQAQAEAPVEAQEAEQTQEQPAAEVEATASKGVKGKVKSVLPQRPKGTKMPGLMRFYVVLFALNFVFTLLSLSLISRDFINYNQATLIDFLNIVLEVVLLWMLWCRFKVARPYVMCFTVFNITVGWLGHFLTGTFNLGAEVWSSLFDILLFLYFATSKKARAYLTEPFGVEKEQATANDKELKINRKSWAFWRNLGIYYCVFSLVGHWMEAALCQLMRFGIIQGDYDPTNTMLWRDWFYPYPMEGLAVVFIALLLYPLWRWLLTKFKYPVFAYALSFICNALLCAAIEYTMGIFVNADLQLWDYSNMPFNINGMVCLQNTFGFGVIASLIAWMVYPALERLLAKVPKNIMMLLFVIILAAYAIPQTLYLIDPPDTELALEIAADDSSLTAEQQTDAKQRLEEYENGEDVSAVKPAEGTQKTEESADSSAGSDGTSTSAESN